MKTHLVWIALVLSLLGSGCASPKQQQAVRDYEQRMSAEWLKANIHVGQTTKEEIRGWFGKPLSSTAMAASGAAGQFMPDEMWTYSVRFTEMKGGLNMRTDSRTRAVVFSFKNGLVSNYAASNSEL